MPTYSYECTECGNRFDIVQAFTDDTLTTCETCSGRLRKLFNSVGIVFKGSGFYRTDSREAAKNSSGSANGSSSSDSGSGSSEKSSSSDKSGSSEKKSGSSDKSGGSSEKKSGSSEKASATASSGVSSS